ncbi:uncharacterized protein LOC119383635 isoform X2 [Rhipicephalus sanguineus]|uniref:Transglutaminase-like domain-containing protein n=2 Tax=Rhipicephalus sanguineus TaxID=34632 RepID=A0A9D4T4I8_RHISA|nr:uncharacterized protein LOC119383635 isoform X2 [Rhipicephalus sanguineus]KAH7969598.1 hypothetical protein HPB52_020132 [Rhipicephalus sanguineus]
MGCGVSKVHAAADPSSQQPKRGFAAQVRWSQDASKRSTPTALTERLVDAQVQVENKYEQRDRVTQTDIHFNMTRGNYNEDDLDFDEDGLSSFGDDYTDEGVVENGASPGGSREGIRFADPRLVAPADGDLTNRSSTPVALNTPASKQQMLMMDAEQRILMLSKRIHLDIDMTPRSVATTDVGVQAGSGRNNRWTQTERCSAAARGGALQHPPMGLPPDASGAARLSRTTDIESQTDPVSRAPAANAAGGGQNESLSDEELSSPLTHIEKMIGATESGGLSDAVAQILEDMDAEPRPTTRPRTRRTATGVTVRAVSRRDTGVQTVNDPVTDEAPEYAARPPPCKKREMIPSMAVFQEVDRIALKVPNTAKSTLQTLVYHLISYCRNDLQKIRMFFRWIAENITYDWRHMETKQTPEEVFVSRQGVCKDYCLLLSEMCRLAGIREKTLQGFAKGFDYRPGHQFHPGQDVTHAWNAVFILGAWRLIDATWGTGYTDHTGKFIRKINEHFFVTDPEVLIWTHFPYDEMEKNYSRWQLLDKPLTLEEFNSLPKVTPHFFQLNMRLRTRPQNPITFKVRTELRIASHEPMRYKFKLYPSDETENAALNNYVFCHLLEDRCVACFGVTPPTEGQYILKIYANREREMRAAADGGTAPASASLQNIGVFLLECLRAKKYLVPYPLNEVPWGPTQTFYDYNMRLVDQSGPVIVSWGAKRKLTIDLSEAMLVSHQLLDADGVEMELKGMITREDKDRRVTFQIVPQRVGMFKLVIFAMPKPKFKGKWRLPLVATFLIDCKLTRLQLDEELRLAHHRPPLPEEDKEKENEKEKGKRVRISTVR